MSGTLQASVVKDGASGTNNLALDASGNVTAGANFYTTGSVGIGTASPTAPISINNSGGPAASGNMNTGLYIGGTGSYSINIGGNAVGQYAWINAAFQNNSGVAAPLVLMTGATERARIDTSGNLQVGGTTVTNTAGYVNSRTNTRAWATFNGLSGASPVILSSYNISSITRTGTGTYTVAMTTALADTNYAVTFGAYNASGEGSWNTVTSGVTITTSQFGIATFSSGGSAQDQTKVFFAVFGN